MLNKIDKKSKGSWLSSIDSTINQDYKRKEKDNNEKYYIQ